MNRPLTQPRPHLDRLDGTTVAIRLTSGLDGHWSPDSVAVAKFWTPLAGPGVVTLGRLAVVYNGQSMPAIDLAAALGVKCGVLVKIASRMARFNLGTLTPAGDGLERLDVVALWPLLKPFQIDRLPVPVRNDYLRKVVAR